MNAVDRRTVLRLGLGAAIVPLIPAGPACAAGRFAPPAGPMRYIRRLARGLGDGAEIVVVRQFAIRFLPAADGFRIEGEQVGVEVEAPARLARFAQLERERVEAALFPLLLDGEGRIVAKRAGQPSAQLDAAVREALERLPRGTGERDALRRLVEAVHQGAGRMLTELPPDLFAPSATPRAETREVALPGGGAGTVAVTFSALSEPATGLLREARREVLTTLSGETRRTLETWQLVPLA